MGWTLKPAYDPPTTQYLRAVAQALRGDDVIASKAFRVAWELHTPTIEEGFATAVAAARRMQVKDVPVPPLAIPPIPGAIPADADGFALFVKLVEHFYRLTFEWCAAVMQAANE